MGEIDPPIAIGIAAAATLILSLVVVVGWQHRLWRAAERDRDRALNRARMVDAMLDGAPEGFFVWGRMAGDEIAGRCSRRLAVLLDLFRGREASFDDVLDGFEADSQAALRAAVEKLHQLGSGFAVEMALATAGRRIAARGMRVAGDDGAALADVVWMSDVTEGAAAVDALSQEGAHLRRDNMLLGAALDGLQVPVWVRDDDLSLIYCNRAYVHAVDGKSAADVVARGREIAPRVAVREARALAAAARSAGEPRRAPFHMVLDGSRRLMEVTESPVDVPAAPGAATAPLFSDGSGRLTAGFAYDITRQEELETRLRRETASQSDVLERLGTAIAVFGPDTRLIFHNTAFARLWQVDPAWLSEAPGYAALLDALRAQRRLPEVADFPAYKEKELSRFNSLIDPIEDVLHLPDGGSLRRVVAPHPLGGLLTTYEDVTDKLALERSYNTLIAVQRETIDNLQEAVAVIGPDGRFRLANPAYADLWNLNPQALAESPTLTAVVDAFGPLFDDPETFSRHRGVLLGSLDAERQRATQQGRVVRGSGSVLEFIAVPLPDGGVLYCYNDVSAPERAAQTLRGRAETLAAGEKLKTDVALRMSAECAGAVDGILSLSSAIAESSTLGGAKTAAIEMIKLAQGVALVLAEARQFAAVDLMQTAPRLDSVDIADAIGRAQSMVRQASRTAGIEVVAEVSPDPGWMVADPVRTKLMLYLLMQYALETAGGGRIKFTAARIGANEAVEFAVRYIRRPGVERERGRAAYDLARRLAAIDGGELAERNDGGATVIAWTHLDRSRARRRAIGGRADTRS
jgi:PAS domain-containing protein